MHILTYTSPLHDPFANLLVAYFTELDIGIPEEVIRSKILPLILQEQHSKTLEIALMQEHDQYTGFSIYQIDSPDSDWCKRPGWGCIREFYIRPHLRRNGFGRVLAQWTEARLREMGATGLYLTADDALPFWAACGFHRCDEICSNNLEILTK